MITENTRAAQEMLMWPQNLGDAKLHAAGLRGGSKISGAVQSQGPLDETKHRNTCPGRKFGNYFSLDSNNTLHSPAPQQCPALPGHIQLSCEMEVQRLCCCLHGHCDGTCYPLGSVVRTIIPRITL